MRKKRGGLVLVGSKMTPALAQALAEFAAKADLSMSAAVAWLVQDALERDGGAAVVRDLQDEGYQAGVRQGLHEVRQHMKKLYGEK